MYIGYETSPISSCHKIPSDNFEFYIHFLIFTFTTYFLQLLTISGLELSVVLPIFLFIENDIFSVCFLFQKRSPGEHKKVFLPCTNNKFLKDTESFSTGHSYISAGEK